MRNIHSFSDDEVELLRKNPFTYRVTSQRIAFSADFKHLFWQKIQHGISPEQAVSDLGYDPTMLGSKRIHGILQRIRSQAHSGIEFYSGYPRVRQSHTSTVRKSDSRDLKNEVLYLRLERNLLITNFKLGKIQKIEELIQGKTSSKFEIIHKISATSSCNISITHLCNIAGVSRSGYYNWLSSQTSRDMREKKDQEDFELILQAYKFRGYDKGARMIHMRLLHMTPPVVMNVKKIRRLMNKYNLHCPIRKADPYRNVLHSASSAEDTSNILKREFTLHGVRKVLLTDITYIPFNNKFAYLSTVLDAYTRQCLSYTISDSLEMDLVLDTVLQLIQKHGISLDADTLIHSDRGSHYTSCKFNQIIANSNIRQSMSRKGNCWDNAPQESFFSHMKHEINLTECLNYEEVKNRISDWIDYYNKDRYQWRLAKLSPDEYYQYITTGNYPIHPANTK